MGKGGRAPCCDKNKVKRGPWSPAEDTALILFIHNHGYPNWRALPKQAGLLRCGKSCRLRWMNYLRPDVKRGNFTNQEEDAIITLHRSLGNKWSQIASHLPGRTDNEIKNVWNTHLKKRLAKSDTVTTPQEDTTSSASCSSISVATSSTKTGDEGLDLLHLQATKLDQTSSNHQEASSHHHADTPVEEGNLEADVDFWNMLEGLGRLIHSENDIIVNEGDNKLDGGRQQQRHFAPSDEETVKWLHYIEHELGLDHDNHFSPNYTHTTSSSSAIYL